MEIPAVSWYVRCTLKLNMSPPQECHVKNGNNSRKALVISFILNVLLLCVFIILLVLRGNSQSNKEQTEWTPNKHILQKMDTNVILTEDDICLSCDELGDSVNVNDTLYDFITKSSCGGKLCCFKGRGLKMFISKVR